MHDIHQVLATNEHILRQVKPKFLPYALASRPKLWATGIFWPMVAVAFGLYYGSEVVLLAVVGFTFAVACIAWIQAAVVHHFALYTITDKRTIFQEGVIGRDFTSIEHDKITGLNVSVGLVDKLFGGHTGTVQIIYPGLATGVRGIAPPHRLRAIADPQEMYQYLETVSRDVRTDIRQPNALRPQAQSGYTTSITH